MRKCSNSPSSRPRATPDRIRSSPRRKWSQSRPRNSESIFSSPIVARPRRTIWKVKKASVWVWGSFRKLARNLFGVLRRKAWNMHGNISTSAKIYRPGVAPANLTSCAATCLFHFFLHWCQTRPEWMNTYLKLRFLNEKCTSTIPVVFTRVLRMSCSVGW